MVMTPEHQSQDNTPIQQPALKEKVDRSRLIILTGDKKWSVVQVSAEFSGKGKVGEKEHDVMAVPGMRTIRVSLQVSYL